MLNLIPIDCLNNILTFGTAREMGRVMSTSKKCRANVCKCNYAWYEMYIRLYKTTNKDHDKHDCEYNLTCLKNPYKKTSCHYGREYEYWTSLIRNASQFDVKYQSYGFANRYDVVMYRTAINQFYNGDRQLENYGNPKQLRQEFDELCKIIKHCVNPTHTRLPKYDDKKNFRREFRIFFINTNKKVKFTNTDMKKLAKLQEELDALQRKKRIAELVADYE